MNTKDSKLNFSYGSVTFSKQVMENSSKEERNKFILSVKPTLKEFFNKKRFTICANVIRKHFGEFPNFDYVYEIESDFLKEKAKIDCYTIKYIDWWWPFGCAGQFWLKKQPEADSI